MVRSCPLHLCDDYDYVVVVDDDDKEGDEDDKNVDDGFDNLTPPGKVVANPVDADTSGHLVMRIMMMLTSVRNFRMIIMKMGLKTMMWMKLPSRRCFPPMREFPQPVARSKVPFCDKWVIIFSWLNY